MAYSINNLLCTSCGNCMEKCPQNAISEHNVRYIVIDESRCSDCGTCVNVCSSNAIMALSKTV